MPKTRPLTGAATLAAIFVLGACASAPQPSTSAAEVGESRPGSGYVKGHLSRAELPGSLALVPPAERSGALTADIEAFHALAALQKGPRGVQASKGVELKFPAAASCCARHR